MINQTPPITFEDIPLDQARRMGRGLRIDPELHNALREKIQSLANTATRIPLPEGTSATTMKNRILRVAAEVQVPVTVRRVAGGLLFWRSSDEDIEQARGIAERLQGARRGQRSRPGRRRRT